jgi:hypothetical protein
LTPYYEEISRLASSKWCFICGKKLSDDLRAELELEFPEIFNLCTAQFLWFRARYQELARTLIPAEGKMIRGRVSRKEIAEERMWRKRPDGVAIKMSTDEPNRWQKINTHPSDQLLAIPQHNPCGSEHDIKNWHAP